MAKRLADNVTIYINGNASATDGIKTILSSCKPESKPGNVFPLMIGKSLSLWKAQEKTELRSTWKMGQSRERGLSHINQKVR
jgi:hypothetical protein